MKTAEPKLNLKKLSPHPLSAMFPPMGDDAYDKLKGSLNKRGFDPDEPIVLFEGQILDGNNRYTATSEVRGCEPCFRQFEGDFQTAIEFVIAKNLGRRHLDASQSATLGAELVEKMEHQSNGSRGNGTKAGKAAKVVGVSERAVAEARALKKADPEQFEEVKKGKKKLHTATRETEKKSKAELAAIAKDRIEAGHGADFALLAEKHLTAQEMINLSGIDADEIVRIKPLIECGWKLKAALGFKSTLLLPTHPIRALLDRTVAQGGTFDWECEAYGQRFVITITQTAKTDVQPN